MLIRICLFAQTLACRKFCDVECECHGLISSPGWRKEAKENAKALLEKYFPGNGIDVTKTVDKLSLADQQVVEICKTLMTDNLKILILDEPTSALSTDKAQQLHKVVANLARKALQSFIFLISWMR